MDHDRLDKKLDEWLDAALAEYGKAEPRPGIEARVVQNLRSRAAPSIFWFNWRRAIRVAAGALALVILVLVVSIRREPPRVPEIATSNDQELLRGVDRLLDHEVAAPLEPALVLTREMVKSQK